MNEFELIRRYFGGDAPGSDVRVGIGDDGAVLVPAAEKDIVAVVDTLIEDVHFPSGLDPFDIGFRAAAVNLSDIAAMGARPRWMTLALTLVDANPDWLQRFSDGLRSAGSAHCVTLVGGDTTRGSQLVVSVQIIGDVPAAAALLRSGAGPGDRIYVSGHVGDAAAGLTLMSKNALDDRSARALAERFRRPSARIELGLRIAPLATAAIDVSDGLHGDLRKLLEASGHGGELNVERLPLSKAILSKFPPDAAQNFALAGGDDYELCFTAPAAAETSILDISADLNIPITRIGAVRDGAGLLCTEGDTTFEFDDAGYSHF